MCYSKAGFFFIVNSIYFTVADSRGGGALGASAPLPPYPSNKSSTYINIRFSRLFVVTIVVVQMCLAFKKGLRRSPQERSLDLLKQSLKKRKFSSIPCQLVPFHLVLCYGTIYSCNLIATTF